MKTWTAAVAIVMQTVLLAGAGFAVPYTRIVSPVQGQCVAGPDVKVQFEAGGMVLGPTAWNLHVKLDEEPFHIQYDGNHAHTFKNVPPGTHTVRMYAANAMQEAIAGTQSVVVFHVGYADGANAPEPGRPLLTYNLPQGEYLGIDSADVTVDFILENVTLSPGGYQLAYYVDGRRFLVQDMCGPRHVKDLNAGYHRVRMELQDHNGDLVPGAFNSTERVILISPDSVAKSPAGDIDGYEGQPRLDSIKGSMTMGQSWSATEPIKPLTKKELELQNHLTVRTDSGTVALNTGVPVAVPDRVEGTEALTGVYKMTSQNSAERSAREVEVPSDYNVRQDGTTDLDTKPASDTTTKDAATKETSSNVRKGSITVSNNDAEQSEDQQAKPADEAHKSVQAIDDDSKADSESKSSEIKHTSDTATRLRADGTRSQLSSTSATLHLKDRQNQEKKVEDKTTSTIHVEDAGTTRAKARVERGDRPSTRTTSSQPGDRNSTGSARAKRDDSKSTDSAPALPGTPVEPKPELK